MKTASKIIFLIGTFTLFLSTQAFAFPFEVGDVITMADDWSVPYTMTAEDGKDYATFCLESGVYFTPGETYTVQSVGDTIFGDVSGSGIKLGIETTKLYAAFSTGIFDGIDTRAVQSAIWQSIGDSGDGYYPNALARLTRISEYQTFNASGWDIRAVNLVTVDANGNITEDNQSQLVGVAPVPEPATMLLFGTGLVGLAGVRLRRKK